MAPDEIWIQETPGKTSLLNGPTQTTVSKTNWTALKLGPNRTWMCGYMNRISNSDTGFFKL